MLLLEGELSWKSFLFCHFYILNFWQLVIFSTSYTWETGKESHVSPFANQMGNHVFQASSRCLINAKCELDFLDTIFSFLYLFNHISFVVCN